MADLSIAVKPAGNCDNAVLRTIHIKSYKAVRKSFEGLKGIKTIKVHLYEPFADL